MSKKKSMKTDISVRGKKQSDENPWKNAVDALSLNDHHWWCIVTMMVETTTDHAHCVSIFNEVAEQGERKAIYSLSRQKMMSDITTISKQDFDKYSVMQDVCHHANKILNDGGKLPTWLVARVLKYLIYRAKVEAVVRLKKELELKRAIEKEYMIMQTVVDADAIEKFAYQCVKGSKERKVQAEIRDERVTKSHLGAVSRGKKGGNQAEPEYSLKGKANTRLRVRSEKWRDVDFIDDAPIDGPNLYVVLTGFHDPNLPAELISVGVPLVCILKIKRPGEKLQMVKSDENMKKDSCYDVGYRSFYHYSVNESDLQTFWLSLKKDLADPTKLELYSDIVFLRFGPPLLPETMSDNRLNAEFKADIYERISYIVYDLYELYRKYSNYLRSMKLTTYKLDETEEKMDYNVYREFLDALPMQCVSVQTILLALVSQVESNLVKESTTVDRTLSVRDASLKSSDLADKTLKRRKVGSKNHTSIHEETPFLDHEGLIRQRLSSLDLKYATMEKRIPDTTTRNESKSPDPRLVLHGDTDCALATIQHSSIEKEISEFLDPGVTLTDAISGFLENSRLTRELREHFQRSASLSKLQGYERHIDEIARLFEPEASIDFEGAVHHAHLLIFDKIIHDSRCEMERPVAPYDAISTIRDASKSPLLSTIDRMSNLTRISWKERSKGLSKSDTLIEYGKIVSTLIDFAPLFRLTDTRELLMPGYLQRNVFEGRSKFGRPCLDDYEDVELLPSKIFLSIAHECLRTFDRLETRYFEPTDSILLCFTNDYRIDDVHTTRNVWSIRTPVCFREFGRYVIYEETEWMTKEEERLRSEDARTDAILAREIEGRDKLRRSSMTFGDECFVLARSLKARYRRDEFKLVDSDSAQMATSSTRTIATAVGKRGKLEKKKKSKKGSKGRVFEVPSRKGEFGANDVDASFLQPRKLLSFECAKEDEPYNFVGYDLGRLRVQVDNVDWVFASKDGTLVRMQREHWLYGSLDLRIAVTLRGCSLRLQERIGPPRVTGPFHLTTKRGLVLAFARCQEARDLHENFNGRDWKTLDFDFRASWPSGLTIEPVRGDSPENPFYIRQSYVSKGLECSNVAEEVCRKFLRNGTVLKYLDDGSVTVLRPNGVIVRCTDFEGSANHAGEGTRKNDSGQAVATTSTKQRTRPSLSHSASKVSEYVEEKRGTSTSTIRTSIISRTASHTDASWQEQESRGIRVTRYTVLNHDGGRYDVEDDLVVREHDRLLVRTTSDYEVDEKFTRRADGTDMLLRSNGELIVNFIDGTRITTGYKIEEKAIICEWSEDEYLRFFGDKHETFEERCSATPTSSNDELARESSTYTEYHYENERKRILIADSFVSVLLTCRIEHKNYATVSYDQSAVSCALSMPDDLRVSISRRGHYEVSAAGKVNLKILKNYLTFSNEVCPDCAGKSWSVYRFYSFPGIVDEPIFTTVDFFGNIFDINADGTTNYQRRNDGDESRLKKVEHEMEESIVLEEEEKEEKIIKNKRANDDADKKKSNDDRRRYHENYCQWRPLIPTNSCRIFAMNRDLTAYEYLHRSVKHDHKVATNFDNDMSVILHSIMDKPDLHYIVTFVPFETVLRSKALLQSYQIPKVVLTNNDRMDLLRSTYSIPYDWLFPFGRNGVGIYRNTHDVPLARSLEQRAPETLIVRVLRGFKMPNRNAVIDLQKALGRYWLQVATRSDKEREAASSVAKSQRNSKNDEDTLTKDDMKELALGRRTNIDLTTYIDGLPKKHIKTRAPWTSERLVKLLESRKSMNLGLDWYKRCIREKIILPYFETIVGSCFLWVEDSVEQAMEISDMDESEETAG